MAIYNGSSKIESVYRGSSKMESIYVGSTLVYEDKLPAGQVLFESSTSGGYSVILPKKHLYKLTLVGAGGGCGFGGSGHYTNYNAAGGSGALLIVTALFPKNLQVFLSIGAKGTNTGGASVGTWKGTNGGDTTLIPKSIYGQATAGGGGGGSCMIHSGTWAAGNGGVVSVEDEYTIITSTAGKKGAVSAGGGGAGGASVYNGYGKGNDIYSTNGTDGYAKIETL